MNTTRTPAGEGAPTRWLLAVDGSPHSNQAAQYVARWAGALGVEEVCILNAQPIESYRAYALNRDRMLQDATEHAAKATAFARQALDSANVRYRLQNSFAEPAEAICDAARAQRASEIVLGTRGHGALTSLVLGSIAYKVIHLASEVVTVIPHSDDATEGASSTNRQPLHRVLLCVDGSPTAQRAVDYVSGLAGTTATPIEAHLVNVRAPVMPRTGVGAASFEDIDRAGRDGGEAVLRAAEKSLAAAGIRFQSHLVIGQVADSIDELGTTQRCARVILGSRGLSAMKHLALGSVAYQVIHHASLPVTVVK